MMDVARFGKVAVLMGGSSSEREISLRSGTAVLNALTEMHVDATGIDVSGDVFQRLRAEKFDRAFIALHGFLGEDGSIQGGLDVIGMPYSGCGVLASSVCMNKWMTKQIWSGQGIPTPAFRILKEALDPDALVKELGLPMVFKPASQGSSIGITKVNAKDEIIPAWEHARELEGTVIAEEWIDGQEYTAAVLTDQILPMIRLETPRTFYDFDAKYQSSDTRYHCPCGLSAAQETSIKEQALQAFKVTAATGWGRIDLMLDSHHQPWFLEINTVPGMTDHSLVPMAAKAEGINFNDLVIRILETSFSEHA
ncbi:MAG: D-alanine--D-alanine ligase [Gammaproteobacteria bacterium]|nr:D-alanine--D-alanine ligase [Gammaproteobacteria bacterium]